MREPSLRPERSASANSATSASGMNFTAEDEVVNLEHRGQDISEARTSKHEQRAGRIQPYMHIAAELAGALRRHNSTVGGCNPECTSALY